ncbi:MAG: ABC transporter ATP-binding protein [Alphaproteobacteria bacterium]|nr:ABC transporter ATP-binding protein [Alphaproteobacteria bacterium]
MDAEAQSNSHLIDIDDVSLRYGVGEGSTLALAGTSFQVSEGEFISLVGPSGCGKSTIVKLVSGLMPVTGGRLTVDGQPVTGPLSIVGIAFQNPVMLPWLSTLDNVLLPLKIVRPHRDHFRQRKEEFRDRARALLKVVGLDGFEQKFPWQLSGGMRQRASLCRALIHEPRLLLLDEPFASLDAFTREELWGVLQDLWLEKKPTIIMITHELREAVYLSDKVYVMSARPGRILYERDVRFDRPRPLEITFDDAFVEVAQDLRQYIQLGRNETSAEAGP